MSRHTLRHAEERIFTSEQCDTVNTYQQSFMKYTTVVTLE